MTQHQNQTVSAEKVMSTLGIVHVNRYLAEKQAQWKKQLKGGPLSLWTEDAESAKALLSYIGTITDRKSADYIPPKDRIAVFDMDGTLFCETDPTYFDFCLYHYRITADPDYKDRTTEEERALVRKLEDYVDTGMMAPGLEVEIGKGIAQAFSGMTVEEFTDYVIRFGNRPAHGYEGMTAGEAFYRPMLQVLDLLKDKGFVVFICSGTDRQVVRGLVSPALELPPRQVLGTAEEIVARDQGGTDGTGNIYTEENELILKGSIVAKNLKMNKVSVIAQEIGQQPVLCFGNSAGDISMANYVTDSNRYKTYVSMLCCDDLERENGNLEKAVEMVRMCEKNGWVPVSMKNDWKTIYGDGVTKKPC